MGIMSLFSNLTYESILSPMILSRSGNDQFILLLVNTLLGIGSIVGGIIMMSRWFSFKKTEAAFYFFAGVSFLLGDGLMTFMVLLK